MNYRVRLLALSAVLTMAAFGQDARRTRAGAVTGAPYSAEVVTERVQTLAGWHAHHSAIHNGENVSRFRRPARAPINPST